MVYVRLSVSIAGRQRVMIKQKQVLVDIQEGMEIVLDDDNFKSYWADVYKQNAAAELPIKNLCAAFYFLGSYEAIKPIYED